MSDRTQRFIAEVGRFLVVGGAATIVALLIFNYLVHGFSTGEHAPLGDEPILAFVIANTIGMCISYYGSRHWAFRDRQPVHSDGGKTSFVAINLLTMLIPIACLALSRDVLGLDDPISDNVSANLIGLVLGLVARFYLFRTFVFRRPISLVEIYDEPQLDEPTTPPQVSEAPALSRGPSSCAPAQQPARAPEGD